MTEPAESLRDQLLQYADDLEKRQRASADRTIRVPKPEPGTVLMTAPAQVPEHVYLDAARAYFDEEDEVEPSERAIRLAKRPYFRRAVDSAYGQGRDFEAAEYARLRDEPAVGD